MQALLTAIKICSPGALHDGFHGEIITRHEKEDEMSHNAYLQRQHSPRIRQDNFTVDSLVSLVSLYDESLKICKATAMG